MKIIYPLLALALSAASMATAQNMASPASLKNAPPHSIKTAAELYRTAAEAARRNELRVALRQLKQAVSSGFFTPETIENDPDLTSLRNQAGWSRLLNQARARRKKHEAAFDPQLLALMKKMHYQDQHYRVVAVAAEKQYGLDSPQVRAADNKQSRLDPQLIRQVDSLIAIHGYPGKSKVGEYYKSTAFLVIQHNPDEKYLPLLTAAADKGELNWSSLALLIDRLKTEKGELQIYGSQPQIWADGRKQLFPIEDEQNVNVRRAKIGLEPLEEYLKHWDIAYQVPTATHNPNPPELYVRLKAEREEHKSPVELVGGYEALYSQLQYPAEAHQKGIKGHVMLQLTIDPQGVPQDVVVVQGLGASCDEEALRVMRAARFTNPGGQDHEIRMRLPFPYVAAAGK